MADEKAQAQDESLAWYRVATDGELPADGTGLALEVAGARLAVFRDESGDLHAVDDMCPHAGGSLGMGVLQDGEITCPWHAMHFDACSGLNTDGLAMRIRVFPVRINPAGDVEVGLRPTNG